MEGALAWTLGNIRLDPSINRDTQYREGSGVHWFLESENGFWGSPGNDATRTKNFNRHGSTIGPGWKEERIISLEGYVFAPTFEQLRRAVNQITALLSDPYNGTQLTCHSEIGDFSCEVFLDGEILTQHHRAATPAVTFSLQLVAPDPRKYDPVPAEMSTTLPDEGTGGLDFGDNSPTSGLVFTSSASNRFENPILAGGVDWWVPLDNSTPEWVTTTGVPNNTVGNRAIRSTAVAAGQYGFRSPLLPTTTEPAMTFSAFVMSPSAVTVTMFAGWYDENGGYLSDNGGVSVTLTPNTWHWISSTTPTTKPSGAKNFGMILRSTATTAGQRFDATGLLAEQATTPTSNYDFSQGGSSGLEFGTNSNATGQLFLRNEGTAPTNPVFRLHGPLSNPTITANGLYSLKYNGDIDAGQYVEIDPSAPSVMLDGVASRRHLLSPAQFSGFTVPPASFDGVPGTLTVGLSHQGPANAEGYLTVTYYHAWF